MIKKILMLIGIAASLAGCATQSAAISDNDRIAINGRLEELEATQARLRTRIVVLEKNVDQLEERISLMSRRTSLDAREVVRIEPNDSGVSAKKTGRSSDAVVYVTPTTDEVYEEIVISDDKKRAYFGSSPNTGSYVSNGSNPPRAASSGTRKPYENVTDEKLPSMSASAPTSTAPVSPMTYYQEGIDLYRRGLYDEGRTRFEAFLATNPETEYIDNALYWIGECYYGQGAYNEAATYFHKIVQEYPKTSKVPDALLKVSLTYQQLGRNDSAREMLRYLMEAFPGSEAARIGKEKYEAMIQSAQ